MPDNTPPDRQEGNRAARQPPGLPPPQRTFLTDTPDSRVQNRRGPFLPETVELKRSGAMPATFPRCPPLTPDARGWRAHRENGLPTLAPFWWNERSISL